MLFNSVEYFLFFPLVCILYFWLPHRFRWALLLAASYFFYMSWRADLIVLIIASTFVDYFAGIMMGRQAEQKARRKYLYLSLITNLGLLFTFKYFNFFSGEAARLLTQAGVDHHIPAFHLILPMGISFYTFQTMSYSIDVYHGRIKPEKHFGIFALFVTFFPQLVAGPIERAENLLSQFKKQFEFSYERAADGLRLIGIGLFKKVIIADRVALIVNRVYNNPDEFDGPAFFIATIAFAFQIYCDFSGYSDIAIGSAKVMGFKLMDNFQRPYFSRSVSEFWRRWHISLSTWFRDYLYIPMGGNRVVKWRWYYNLFITFLVSGLWHGANWTFIIWGALHGFYLVADTITKMAQLKAVAATGLEKRPLIHWLIRGTFTFALVCFAWIFFRANNIQDAFSIVGGMASGWEALLSKAGIKGFYKSLGMQSRDWLIALAAIGALQFYHVLQERGGLTDWFKAQPAWLRWGAYYLLIAILLLFGVFNQSEFIYFQF